MRWRALAVALVAAGLAGCGGDESSDTAVEATEANVVTLDGVTYHVPVFRELNVRTAPDDALWQGAAPADGANYYGVVLRSCAEGDEPAEMIRDLHLEDAFGQVFEPLTADTAQEFRYEPATLEPGECRPGESDTAEQVYGGSVVVFEVPVEASRERPLVLQINSEDGADERRLQLDL